MRTNRILVVTLIVAGAAAAAGVYALKRSQSPQLKPDGAVHVSAWRGQERSGVGVLRAAGERARAQRSRRVRWHGIPIQRSLPQWPLNLNREGYPAPMSNPRKGTSKEVESADVVISIGCDLSGLPEPRGKLVRWDDVPPLSEDFARADDAIRKRVMELIEELVRTSKEK